jgi:hypothetical protein
MARARSSSLARSWYAYLDYWVSSMKEDSVSKPLSASWRGAAVRPHANRRGAPWNGQSQNITDSNALPSQPPCLSL